MNKYYFTFGCGAVNKGKCQVIEASNEVQAIEYVLKKYPIKNKDNIFCQCIHLKKGLIFDLDI